MHRYTLIVLFVSICLNSNAQPNNRPYETNPDRKRANVWYFGKNAGIDFNYSPPKPLTDGKVNTIEACASICDTSGKLILYTDGMSIWNIYQDTIKQGAGINVDPSATQGALFVKYPLRDSLVYLFTLGTNVLSELSHYSLINQKRNNVIEKNILLFERATEKLTSINHRNLIWQWVTFKGLNDSFYNFLITENGIISKPYISFSSINKDVIGSGAMKFSMNGNLLAICNRVYLPSSTNIEIIKFDNNTSQLDSHLLITNIFLPYGLEFSPNSKYLYVSESSRKLVQFSLKNYQKDSINNSRRVLADISGYDQIQGLQMGPDGNIYLFGHDSLFLGRIVNPDSANARFEGRGLYLGGKKSEYGSPNFHQSIFHTPSIDFRYKYDCTKNTVSFNGLDTFNSTIQIWKVKKKYSSIGQSIYSGKHPSMTFQDSGIYIVKFIASNSSLTDSVIKEITILKKVEEEFLGKDTAFCENSTYHVKVNAILSPDIHSYQWSTGDTSRSIDINSPGEYSVIVTMRSVCQVLDTITVSEIPLPPLAVINRTADTLTLTPTVTDSVAWYLDGIFISGGGSGRLTVEEKGRYHAIVYNSQGCFSSSDTILIDWLSGIVTTSPPQPPQVYPNPFTGTLEIKSETPILNITITGMDGTLILEKTVSDSRTAFDLESLSPGFYLCRIVMENGQVFNLPVSKN